MSMDGLSIKKNFFAVGQIAQAKGTQKIADIRGLTVNHPLLGWGLVVGVIAIAGMFFFSSRRRHTRLTCDWSSDVCSSDLGNPEDGDRRRRRRCPPEAG